MEMQIKSTMKYYITPVRIAIIKRQEIVNVGKGNPKREPEYTINGNVNWYNHYGKLWRFLQKLRIELPCDPHIPLLGEMRNTKP